MHSIYILQFVFILESLGVQTVMGANIILTADGTDPGAPCHFPYIYGGVAYWWCTTDGSPIWPWCGTTDNVDRDNLYAFCFLDCVMTIQGFEYTGSINTASDGSTCTRWDQALFPDDDFWGETTEDASNYCYNANAAYPYPYCFTESGSSAVYCDLPSCPSIATVAPCTGKLVDPLPTGSFSASSQAVGYPASSGHMSSGSRWCSQTANTNQYLQIKLPSSSRIVGYLIAGFGNTYQWVTSFILRYSADGINYVPAVSNNVTTIFEGAVWEGNPMAYTIDPPINGKYIRVQPMTWRGDICMSIELYGCPDFDSCTPNPCQNGGVCMDLYDGAGGGYKCNCTRGYYGQNCTQDACISNPCLNFGTCAAASTGDYTCTCMPGFTGTRCDQSSVYFNCLDLAFAGIFISGQYYLNFYANAIPSGCQMSIMVQGIQAGRADVIMASQSQYWCTRSCLTNSKCVSLSYNTVTGMCRLHYTLNTAYTHQPWTYYTKECAGYVNVSCNFDVPTYPVTTIPTALGYNYSFDFYASACSRCVEHNVPYYPYTLGQLWALRNNSYSCKQVVSLTCQATSVDTWGLGTIDTSYNIVLAGQQCNCLLNNSCSAYNGSCACRTANATVTKSDSGVITAKAKLPVTRYLGGEISSQHASGHISIGQLVCTQTTIPVNECDSSPCQNGATCSDQQLSYRCSCTAGWTGDNCDILTNYCRSAPCLNEASCQPSLLSYQCLCLPGYTGTHCEAVITVCSSDTCYNGASCVNSPMHYDCLCTAGYTGPLCETDVDDCLSSPCMNGSTCLNLSGHYQCVCPLRFAGTQCQIETMECSSEPCMNGSTCSELQAGYSCSCVPGFVGLQCQTDVNECASSPCTNNATCVDLVDAYSCQCTAGFTGPQCSNVVIDGSWASWSGWAQCVPDCGNGTQARLRSCTNPPPQNGGRNCNMSTAADLQPCVGTQCTNVSGHWGQWTSWSSCSMSCGDGVFSRWRHCDSPPQAGNSLPCTGDTLQTVYCHNVDCNTQSPAGVWSVWSSWSSCSASCGLGDAYRTRTCSASQMCWGRSNQKQPCMMLACENFNACDSWETWSPCSTSCGDGTRLRRRLCGSNTALLRGVKIEQWEGGHCVQQACGVTECFHCISAVDINSNFINCKGPFIQCPADQPYCANVFSPRNGTISKSCASQSVCNQTMLQSCQTLLSQAVDAVISYNKSLISFPLQPARETMMQLWTLLTSDCVLCCTQSRCNKGFLPAYTTLYNSGQVTCTPLFFAGQLTSIGTFLMLVFTVLGHYCLLLFLFA